VNGFLVRPRDAVQLAERLALLITSAGLRRNMGHDPVAALAKTLNGGRC
jgi:hypothetical protein